MNFLYYLWVELWFLNCVFLVIELSNFCRGCNKGYHPSCVNRDEAFFRAKGVWTCGENHGLLNLMLDHLLTFWFLTS